MKKLFLIVAMTFFLIASASATDQYMIIVDAGSSGSRLHLFQYDVAPAVPVIQDVFSESIKPGLSSYVDHPEKAGAAFKKILDDAAAYLVNHQIDPTSVTINVYATAGMRLLPEDKQQSIHDNVASYIKNNYSFRLGDVKTIKGRMEGLYGWLDVNYVLGNFETKRQTVGSIDMGGASTEIVFATDDKSKPENEFLLTINGKQYNVFSKSFLGLGEDAVRKTMTSRALSESCYPKGYVVNASEKGDFDFSTCAADYDAIIDEQHVADALVPESNLPFIAYSGIYYTYHFFNADHTPDESVLDDDIRAICSKTWDELKKEYPAMPEEYLSVYCADGVYQDQLLYNTYKIKGSQLTVANDLNGQEINWTLGAVLYGILS